MTTTPTTIVVRFLRSSPPYRGGELAGFSPEKAKELILAGAAEFDSVLGDAGGLEDFEDDFDDEPPVDAAAVRQPRLPDPDTVDPDLEVSGLDDADPDWREKAAAERGLAPEVPPPAPAPAPEAPPPAPTPARKAQSAPARDKMERGKTGRRKG